MAEAKRAQSSSERMERLQAGIQSDCPKIYFNGFANGLGTGDVILVVERSGLPQAVLNCSYTVAKTLSVKLGGLRASLEESSGRPILTTDEVLAFQSKAEAEAESLAESPAAKRSGSRPAKKKKAASGRNGGRQG